MDTQLKVDTARLMADVHRIAGEVRVKIHLAGMDLKDEWNKLEPHVLDAELKFASATEASKRGLEELAKSVRRVNGSLL